MNWVTIDKELIRAYCPLFLCPCSWRILWLAFRWRVVYHHIGIYCVLLLETTKQLTSFIQTATHALHKIRYYCVDSVESLCQNDITGRRWRPPSLLAPLWWVYGVHRSDQAVSPISLVILLYIFSKHITVIGGRRIVKSIFCGFHWAVKHTEVIYHV